MSRLPEYLAWLQPKMNDYNDLMTKYKSLKEKEAEICQQGHSRRQKKELLLGMRENKSITKEGTAELLYIQQEEDIKALHGVNISACTIRRDRDISDAKEAYERALTKAEEKYINAKHTYDTQQQQSLTRISREWEAKKNMYQFQKQCIDHERQVTMKSATEISINLDKIKILKEIQKLISMIEYSKKSTLKESEMESAPTVPVLPEPIVTQYVLPTPVAPPPVQAPVTPPVVKYDYSMLGEDPATLALRQEMKLKRREKDMEEEARLKEEMANRPPTRYGLIHELENRPYVKPSYVPPVIEDEPEEKSEEILNDFFTKSLTSDEES